MAVRNVHTESVDDWRGLNTIDDPVNLTPDWWIDSLNVIVGPSGSATALRSPKTITDPISVTPISIFNYQPTVALSNVMIDVDGTGHFFVDTYSFDTTTIPATPVLRRAGQTAGAIWKRLNIMTFCYGLNGTEFIQNDSNFSFYLVGIDKPAAAPTVSIIAGGTLTLTTGVTASYAYRNSVTTHVGLCSAVSSTSAATGGGANTLRIAVVQSAVTGNDGIILFLSTDGGGQRYLVVDANANPIVYANATGNIDISAQYLLDTNTGETAYNYRPSNTAYFMFQHQGRIFLLNFLASDTERSLIKFSGKESIGIGVPTESYPPKNILQIPSRQESALTGISTPVGALILSDKDGYLLTGQVVDAVVSAQNQFQVAPTMQEMKWGLGTYSPRSLQVSPFGAIWLDQYRCIQLWPYTGRPTEIGLPLRSRLEDIYSAPGSLKNVDAAWIKTPEQQYYIMTGLLASGLYRMFIIGFYEDPWTRQMQTTYAVSDIQANCVAQIIKSDVIGTLRCMVGVTGLVQQIMDLDLQGGGWGASQALYFQVMTGGFKNNGNYNHLHSIRFDSNVQSTLVQTKQADDTNIEVHPTSYDDLSMTALIDRYGPHKKLMFTFAKDDRNRMEIRNLRITYAAKGRAI